MDTPAPSHPERLARQLFWYGAAPAGIAAVAAPAADAQIVYTEVEPDFVLTDTELPIDFDGDGDPELIMTEDPEDRPYIAGFPDTDGGADAQVAIVSQTAGGYQYFLPLSTGEMISIGNVATTAAFQYGPTFTFNGADPNGWVGAGDKYAGVQFLLDTGTSHYGWILLEVPENGTAIIKGYAYESTPDEPIEAGNTGTVAIEPGPDGQPGTHALTDAQPNPFTGRTRLALEVAEAQHVRVAVYNALGQEVAVLHDGTLAAGSAHALTLDASALASGVYVVRIVGERFTDVRTLTLSR